MKNKISFLSHAVAFLFAAMLTVEMGIIVGSWIVSVILPEKGIISLISHEGIRWMVGELPEKLASEVLLWIILSAMSWGLFRNVFLRIPKNSGVSEYSERIAIHATVIITLIITMAVGYLLFGPDSILLSATGTFQGSSIAAGIVPLICLSVSIIVSTYGLFSGRLGSMERIFKAMSGGVYDAIPYIILYLATATVIYSLVYIIPLQ